MEIKNRLIQGNCCDKIKELPNELVDLTITSPPYDKLRTYEGYQLDMDVLIPELFRITKKGGVVVWVVGDSVIQGSETGSSLRQALKFIDAGFKLHDTMIYQKNGASFPARRDGNRYSQVFEYMFIFSKGKPLKATLICDKKNRWHGWQPWGGGTMRLKDGSLTKREMKPVPEFSPRTNVWYYNTGKGYTTSDKFAFNHPAMFPEKLAIDHIESWSEKGDLVFDPMAGGGTTLKCAILTGRNYLGIEISDKYCEICKERIMSGYKHVKEHGIFKRDIVRGKRGEELFTKYQISLGNRITPVSSEEDRLGGIDFKMDNLSMQIKFEESYCRYPENANSKMRYTGNVAFEIFSDEDKCVLGGHFVSKAQCIIHLMGDLVALYFDAEKLRKFLLEEILCKKHNYRTSRNGSKCGNRRWYSKTVNIPFEVLKEKDILFKEEQIKEVPNEEY